MTFSENGNFVCRGIRWLPFPIESGAQVDDAPIDSAVVLITPSASIDITGLDPKLAFATDSPHGSMLWIRNKSETHSVTLKHGSIMRAAGNRFYHPDGIDYVIGPKRQAQALYDTDENDLNPGWWLYA